METWLLALSASLTVLVLAIYGRRVYIAVRRWQRKQARLDAINQEYENLRSVRKDAVYHHGWAQSRGEFREAKDHEAHVVDIDRKLGILREQYKAVEDGRLDDFSGVIIAEGSKEK
ncbi:unnamed protein product [Effrenium voratum]|uniref:Uncharacterized protein n=1 Tax=Effrenium voratum TaxID=2562239 RepID=A0AA36JTX9_9DINO|nr:unnamed protein product [Effrenium voratum]CAJ1411571.1 unnamed protein product [Effrenium voratum]